MATTAELLAGLKQKIITLGEQQQGEGISVSDFVNQTIQNIEIPEGTTKIKDNLFYGQTELASVTIPDSVTSIGTSAFNQCSSLTSVTIPDSVTSIGTSAFNQCSSLTSVTIPDSVTNIGGYAFYALTLLKNIKLSRNANVAEAMFRSCNNIEEIYVPEGVTKIGRYAFNDCASLKTAYLPSTVIQIGTSPRWFKIFENDTNLEFVTLGNGFNANNLDLSASTLYSRETILQWLNALADRTGQTAYTLTLGAENLAKLTEEEKQIATNKNWNLA